MSKNELISHTNSIESLYQELGLVLPSELKQMGVKERFQHAYVSYKRSVVDAMHAGQVLIDLKVELRHGEFTSHLEQLGWSPRTAQKYMAFAAVALRFPQQNVAAIPHLEMGKWLELKCLSEQELAEFAEGKEVRGLTIEQAKEQTTEQLKQSLRKYERSINAELVEALREKEEFKTKYETAEARLESQQRQTLERYSDIDLPVWAIAVREEASVHGDLCLTHLAGLDRCLTELHKSHPKALDGEDEMADFRAAAGVAFYNVANVLVQASKALEHAKSFLGKAEVGDFDMSIALTATEAEQITLTLGQINTMLSINESHRVSNRLARQNRVGAPKKNPKAFDDEL